MRKQSVDPIRQNGKRQRQQHIRETDFYGVLQKLRETLETFATEPGEVHGDSNITLTENKTVRLNRDTKRLETPQEMQQNFCVK